MVRGQEVLRHRYLVSTPAYGRLVIYAILNDKYCTYRIWEVNELLETIVMHGNVVVTLWKHKTYRNYLKARLKLVNFLVYIHSRWLVCIVSTEMYQVALQIQFSHSMCKVLCKASQNF